MNTVNFKDTKCPVNLFLPIEEIGSKGIEQIKASASHDEVGPLIAILPDCHVGYGVTIGSVFPTQDAIIPNAVGVDIGCGMIAVNTGIPYNPEIMNREFWRSFQGKVKRSVPVGFNSHSQAKDLDKLDIKLRAKDLQDVMEQKAPLQLGTLGGGNHFLEASYDETGDIWMMVHSGSRHTGLRIAGHYHKLAIESKNKRGLRTHDDLASLKLSEEEGQNYLHDMQWGIDFAQKSREIMVNEMVQAFDPDADPILTINIPHNYAAIEDIDGDPFVVHRKGSTSAKLREWGIIPGSMGSNSYIVWGKGNPDSIQSCSHGAGRKMGRGEAKRTFDTNRFAKDIEHTFSVPSEKYLDESPACYKDISDVIERQFDCIDIMHILTPLITIKGGGRDD